MISDTEFWFSKAVNSSLISIQNPSTCDDPPTEPSPVYIAKASIAFVFVVLSLPMNILTICALWKNFKKSPSYAFIINLCLSNIFFALFVNNLDAVWNLTVQWYAGNIACKVCQFFKQFSLTWSSTAVTCISLDRCLTLLFPLLSGSKSTKRAAIIIIPSLIANFITCAPAFGMIGQARKKSVSSVGRAKRKLEWLAVVLIGAFSFCYGPYYGHALVTGWGDPSTVSSSKALLIWVQSCLYLVPLLYSLVFCAMLTDVKEYASNLFDFSGKNEQSRSIFATSPTVITRFSNRPSPMPSAFGTPRLARNNSELNELIPKEIPSFFEKPTIPKREHGNVFTKLELDDEGKPMIRQEPPKSPRNFVAEKL
ncbi:unnamed protein product [Oikopleura dioica]|uniref:G-protein coupled receptors family 1 profile domain-containing protein n=1 Tax=Oikopleura dioica TaxID=34765 RepID=E4Z2V5_OIKDI|nr:unnamed protein product [Oikopleura dioica]